MTIGKYVLYIERSRTKTPDGNNIISFFNIVWNKKGFLLMLPFYNINFSLIGNIDEVTNQDYD